MKSRRKLSQEGKRIILFEKMMRSAYDITSLAGQLQFSKEMTKKQKHLTMIENHKKFKQELANK